MKSSVDVGNDHEDLSRKAAGHIVDALVRKPDLLLCAAGGSTPLRTYQLLAEHKTLKPDLFRSFRLAKLDEWGGIAMDDPGACETQMQNLLIAPLGIAKDRYIGFNSNPANPETECERVRKRLALEGPIDLCARVGDERTCCHERTRYIFESLLPCRAFGRNHSRPSNVIENKVAARLRPEPRHGGDSGVAGNSPACERGEETRAVAQIASTRNHYRVSRVIFSWLHPNWTLLCDRDAASKEPGAEC